MSEKDIIQKLINDSRETPYVDFKRDYYIKLSQSDLPKDITAFANFVSSEDKYIIFGVEDETREVVGIQKADVINQDSVDAYIARTIEPFVNVVCDTVQLDNGKMVGFIKILSSNTNPPYVIKGDCGKDNKISKGDVFIRKGACNQKALRADFDSMYLNNGNIHVRVHDNLAVIKPIYMKGEVVENPTYGQIDIELFNDTTRPVLINGGSIIISLNEYTIRRRIVSILPNRMISERPLELLAQKRMVYLALFDFLSQDCVDLNFSIDGRMEDSVMMQIELYDTDNNRYVSDSIEGFLIAKGEILHKVKTKHYYANKDSMGFLEKIIFRLLK